MQEDDMCEKEPDTIISANYVGRKRNESIHMKILVPSGAVGAIIGKGGKSIAQVQLETGARIKLSKPNDFYPGTTERVCLIQGTLDGVTRMHNYIMDRMLEKPECATSGSTTVPTAGVMPSAVKTGFEPDSAAGVPVAGDSAGLMGTSVEPINNPSWPIQPGSRLPWGRHQQVKILVPNCTAGLVIGKLGSYVKEIKDRTKAFIQISQKSKEINLLERCITIAGEPDQCRAAVSLVLAKIAEDPQSTSCPTISYSRIQGPVASAYPTGSPFAFTSGCARQPVPTQPSQPRASDLPHSSYMSMGDPYMSPVIQAAFLQAAAAAFALNPRAYYPAQTPSGTHVGLVSTSTPPSSQHLTAPSVSAAYGSLAAPQGSGDAQIATDLGLYASMPQSGPAGHLFTPGSPALWPGCELPWGSATVDAASTASANLPSGTQTAFEGTYQAPFNFAYYAANQPVLASVASRHPSEPFTLNPDLYSAQPYGTPIPFTCPSFRAASPGSIYAGLYSHTSPVVPEVGSNSSKLMNPLGLSQSAIPLSDLFGSLRLSHPSFMDYARSADLGSVYAATPSGLLNVASYPAMLSTQAGSGPLQPAAVPLFEPAGSGRQAMGLVPVEISPPLIYTSLSGRLGELQNPEQSPRPTVIPAAPFSSPSSHVGDLTTVRQSNSKPSLHHSSHCDSSISVPSSVNPSPADPTGTTSPTSDDRSEDVDPASSTESPIRRNHVHSDIPLSNSACSSQIEASDCAESPTNRCCVRELATPCCLPSNNDSPSPANNGKCLPMSSHTKQFVNGETPTAHSRNSARK